MSADPSSSRYNQLSSQVRFVAVVGGTHGNEVHGRYLVKELAGQTDQLKRDYSFHIEPILANPAASTATGTGNGRRYMEKDLNRCFGMTDLLPTNSTHHPPKLYEECIAEELNSLLGPKASMTPNYDFIVDLHSTTSNTGILILCHPKDAFSISLAYQLQKKHSEVSISFWSDGDVPLLPTVSRSGITFEVGPVAHSTTIASLYFLTRTVIYDLLGLINLHNAYLNSHAQRIEQVYKEAQVNVFVRHCTVGFPRDMHGEIVGFIHPSLQGILELASTSSIHSKTAVFQLFDESTVTLDECSSICKVQFWEEPPTNWSALTQTLYPNFVNEAAYYEKDIAFNLLRVVRVTTSEFCC